MKLVLAVIQESDSFSELWPKLVASAGAELRVGGSPVELEELPAACGVVVAAGGVERSAADRLTELSAMGAPEAAVVGVETDYRLVAALLKSGAADYFALPGDLGALRSWMVERVERAAGRENAQTLAAAQREQYDFSRLIGESPGFQAALDRAARVIPGGRATVLVTGETGTGKELLAQAIHYNGPRAARPFVEVNCAALPATLLEAELFGYERGAFTDARVAKPGLFEAAHGGTLFLDEIGDLSPELQAKLLKVLESRRVRRLGSVRDMEVDVRIISATNVDLQAEVRAGRFRKDLYYRLSVIPVALPGLRERGDDVLLLARHFLERFSSEYEMPRPQVTAPIRRALLAYPWPGNVRELRNAIERAVLLGGGVLKKEDLFIEELGDGSSSSGPLPFPAPMLEIERAAARAMVERCGGNKSQAAQALGISRKHLYTLLEGHVAKGGER